MVANKASILIFIKYSNFIDIFSPELALALLEHSEINDHTIELIEEQQPPYGPIYSLGPIELKTLKIHIKINLANNFIKHSKSLAKALIFFDKKSDRSF